MKVKRGEFSRKWSEFSSLNDESEKLNISKTSLPIGIETFWASVDRQYSTNKLNVLAFMLIICGYECLTSGPASACYRGFCEEPHNTDNC